MKHVGQKISTNKYFLAMTTILFMSLFFVFGEAMAATYYISPTGNDGNTGTNAAPWSTFSHAMAVLRPGDTLYIMDGTYYQYLHVTTSGTATNYVTIKALNDGKAIVDGQGGMLPCAIDGQAYVNFEGVVCQNSSSNALYVGVRADGAVGHDINVRRVSAYKAVNHCPSILISGGSGTGAHHILLEDCVASSPTGTGYIAIDTISATNITLRRCFVYNTDPGIVFYETNNSTLENNVAFFQPSTGTASPYGTSWGMTVNATSHDQGYNDTFRGNIVLGNATGQTFYGGFGITDRVNGVLIGNNTTMTGNVSINTTFYGINQNAGTNVLISNNTAVQTRTDLPSQAGYGLIDLETWRYASGVSNREALNSTVTHNSFVGNGNSNEYGLIVNNSGLATGGVAATNTYNNYYNTNPHTYGGIVSASTGEKTFSPSYDTATYGYGAYLMIPPALQGAGANGGDIGAEALYRYQDGALTNTPLWPWPMEDRILKELGISVTWASQGGIWRTLNGVYAANPISPDTTAPSVPSVITATAASSSQINLAWSSSIDPSVSGQVTSGVAGYKVFKNGVQVATTPSTSYSVTGLNASTTYSFTVSAYDGAGNSSSQSATTAATTLGSQIAQPAAVAVNAGGTQYVDQSAVIYQADMGYSGGAKASTPAVITGTTESALYQSQRYGNFSYNIPLANGAYNLTLRFAEIYWESAGSRIFNVNMQGTQVISNLDIFAHVGKNAAYDITIPVSVTNGVLNIQFTSIVDSACISAILVNPANVVVPPTADTTAPSVPSALTATAVSSSQINLAWTASTDPTVTGQSSSGMAGYKVYRNGVQVSTTTTTNYSDTGLNASTAYSYTISAYDVAGNSSAQSSAATASTQTTAQSSTQTSTPTQPPVVTSGVVYKANTGHTGGVTYSTAAAITGTADGTLYQSQRLGNFSYYVPLANGTYSVTLKFDEIYWESAGSRIFNVSLQGNQVISNLDVFAHVGKNAAYDVTLPANVTNGMLTIDFTSIKDNAMISAITVTNGQNVVYAVNAGGPQSVDHSGVVYNADISYSGGIIASTPAAITGAVDGSLYQSQRLGNFSANIPLVNGNYSVTLKFAEIYWESAGSRVFNVNMQGNQVIGGLDVFAHVGQNAAYDLTFPASVTNGLLTIDFANVKDNAMVSAITVSPN